MKWKCSVLYSFFWFSTKYKTKWAFSKYAISIILPFEIKSVCMCVCVCVCVCEILKVFRFWPVAQKYVTFSFIYCSYTLTGRGRISWHSFSSYICIFSLSKSYSVLRSCSCTWGRKEREKKTAENITSHYKSYGSVYFSAQLNGFPDSVSLLFWLPSFFSMLFCREMLMAKVETLVASGCKASLSLPIVLCYQYKRIFSDSTSRGLQRIERLVYVNSP